MLLLEDKFHVLKEKLYISEEFGGLYDSDYDEDFLLNDFYDKIYHLLGSQVEDIPHGASRAAIILKDREYIIKVPFSGMFEEDGDSGELSFHYYNNAGYGESWDYCAAEMKLYNEIKENTGLDMFFLDMTFYGYSKGNYPLYIQEKVYPCGDLSSKQFSSKATKESIDKVFDLRGPLNILPSRWAAVAIDWYGVDKVLELAEYLNQGRKDWDLHLANMGYKSNGAPIILDYIGWSDSY